MKKQIVTAVVVLITSLSMVSCGTKTIDHKDSTTKTEQIANAKYQCSMKCEGTKTYDKPGRCPVCGMDMVKLENRPQKDEHQQHGPMHMKH